LQPRVNRRAQAKCRIILSILCIHVESLRAANFGIHMDQQDQQDQQKATVATPIRLHDRMPMILARREVLATAVVTRIGVCAGRALGR